MKAMTASGRNWAALRHRVKVVPPEGMFIRGITRRFR